MHYIGYLAAAAALYELSEASPVDVSGKKTFTIEQVVNSSSTLITPAQKLYHVYQKYARAGASAPPVVSRAATKATADSSVAAIPEAWDESYLCPVTVGGRTLSLNFDTGSADLWVYSTLQSLSQQIGHTVYNPNDGTSSMKKGYTWDIQYGDGSGAAGKVYADKVVVGSVTATSQAVEAATSVSQDFLEDVQNDGILGLAFSSINTVLPAAQNTFFDTVKSQLSKPLFTADLKKGAPGSYDFGFIDSNKYSGGITYVDVDPSNGFWQFTASGYAIGSGAKINRPYTCIADTGTSLLLLPTSIVNAYYKKVSGAMYDNDQGGWIFPCRSSLPSWSAVIGGTKFTVPGDYIRYGSIGYGLCYGGIQPNTGIGFSIFGDIFLKSQFVVFSEVGGSPKLGFAAQ